MITCFKFAHFFFFRIITAFVDYHNDLYVSSHPKFFLFFEVLPKATSVSTFPDSFHQLDCYQIFYASRKIVKV